MLLKYLQGMALAQKIKELRAEKGWTQLDLAKRAGLGRGYISNLEGAKVVHNPSADALLKLARAFNIKPEELYQAAGYIKEIGTSPRPETPEEIIERLRRAIPQSTPVYIDYPFHAGNNVEPVDFVYRARNKLGHKNIEGYLVYGKCLEPVVGNGDIIIVDREAGITNGDLVACLADNKLCVARLRKVADELWLESNTSKFRFEDCQMAAPVIEVRKRLK